MPTSVPVQKTYAEQEGHYGANTFTNPYNASGMGPKIPAAAWVQVLFGFVLLVGIAILVGAGTGIQRYNDARRLVADGDEMLATLTLRHRHVQRISENQG